MVLQVEDKKQFQSENKLLQENNNKLKARLKGKLPLQGAKHLIWDSLAGEITKFKPY